MQIVDVVIRTEQTACGLSFTWCCAVALIEMSVGRGDSVFSIKTQDSLACCVEDFFFFTLPSSMFCLWLTMLQWYLAIRQVLCYLLLDTEYWQQKNS